MRNKRARVQTCSPGRKSLLFLQRRQPAQLRTWGAPAPGSTPHLRTSSALQSRPQLEQGAWMFLRRPKTILPHPYPLTYGHSSHPLAWRQPEVPSWVQVSATRRVQTGACPPPHSVHPKDARPSRSWKQAGRQRAGSFVSGEQFMPYFRGNPHQTESQELSMPSLGAHPPHTPLSFTFRHTPAPRLTPYPNSAEIQPQHLALMTLQSLRQCAGSFHVAGRQAAHGQL